MCALDNLDGGRQQWDVADVNMLQLLAGAELHVVVAYNFINTSTKLSKITAILYSTYVYWQPHRLFTKIFDFSRLPPTVGCLVLKDRCSHFSKIPTRKMQRQQAITMCYAHCTTPHAVSYQYFHVHKNYTSQHILLAQHILAHAKYCNIQNKVEIVHQLAQTVIGKFCKACRIKLLTTRPSFMCIRGPNVLNILAIRTVTFSYNCTINAILNVSTCVSNQTNLS